LPKATATNKKAAGNSNAVQLRLNGIFIFDL
jgi:hypothetical protein